MPKLFLIPNFIAEQRDNIAHSQIQDLRVFFAEEPKSARALLKATKADFPLSQCAFHDLNEHTSKDAIKDYAKIIKEHDAGVISESGCPCVADPGADLVLLAHGLGVEVIPLVGPSSILLALMASGLNGQSFSFNGYLPKEAMERIKKIKLLEQRSVAEGQTQIFMETPYRNQALFEELLKTLNPKTQLCVALDILGKNQLIQTRLVGQWQNMKVQLPKEPALFIINR